MKVYILKHKGADIHKNLNFEGRITFANNKMVIIGYYFYRLKDAKKYLKALSYPEYYEIATFQINRRYKK